MRVRVRAGKREKKRRMKFETNKQEKRVIEQILVYTKSKEPWVKRRCEGKGRCKVRDRDWEKREHSGLGLKLGLGKRDDFFFHSTYSCH